jgi:flavin-dependent dehydrogenase
MTDSDLYRNYNHRIQSLWRHQLQLTIHARERLATDADLSSLRIVSAATIIRANPTGEHWCAVGDAAFSHDPLSGLGVHHALASAKQAAAAIEEFLTRGKPLNTYASWIASELQKYLMSRRGHYAKERRWLTSPFWQRRV